jgi:hypothetical protein
MAEYCVSQLKKTLATFLKLLNSPLKFTNRWDTVHAGDLASGRCHCGFALMIFMRKIGVMVAGVTI